MYAPLNKIVEAIGQQAAMKLVENFGGTLIYLPLPKNIHADNEIAKAIGVEAVSQLARAWDFDGDVDRRLEIPRASEQRLALKKNGILRDREHMTERQVARKYNLSQRSIRRIVAEANAVGGEFNRT